MEGKVFFKTKDLMTVGNIGGGLASVLVAMEGMGHPEKAGEYLFWAAMCMLIGWVFDCFDGVVARALGQMNQFGAEFDNVADLASYSIAPSFLLYLAYRSGFAWLPDPFTGEPVPAWLQTVVAVVVAVIPALFGCIRFARFNMRKLDIKGFWIGFPRPASALLIIGLLNSHLFLKSPTMHWVGVVIVLIAGFMNLSLVPFISQHERKWSWYLGTTMHIVWISVLVAAVLGPFMVLLGPDFLGWIEMREVLPRRLVFDWILAWLTCYLFIQWTDIPLASRRAIAKLTAGWNEG